MGSQRADLFHVLLANRSGRPVRAGEPGARHAGLALSASGGTRGRAPDWRPLFLDYLLLGYTTATVFSPTDVVPLTRRAKMLMMLESTIPLFTMVIVAARVVNMLLEWQGRLASQYCQQDFGFLEIGRVKALREPAVDLLQQVSGCCGLPLTLPEPCEA
jgi:hypothetical protein